MNLQRPRNPDKLLPADTVSSTTLPPIVPDTPQLDAGPVNH